MFFCYNIKMLEITVYNCHKCDLETINDPNNKQYSQINRKDLEIETKCNWQTFLISVKTHQHKNTERN